MLSSTIGLREPKAVEEVNEILASAGLTMDAVMAQSLSIKLDDIERIDRMTALAEARRNAILREIDGHREILSQNLRRAVQNVAAQVGDSFFRHRTATLGYGPI